MLHIPDDLLVPPARDFVALGAMLGGLSWFGNLSAST